MDEKMKNKILCSAAAISLAAIGWYIGDCIIGTQTPFRGHVVFAACSLLNYHMWSVLFNCNK